MVPSDIRGVERRRRWQDGEKLAILERVGMGGRTVADVAREADVTRQHIYQWRREMRRKGLWPRASGALFVSVEGEALDLPCTTSPGADMDLQIEIGLRNGRQLRCPPSISPAVNRARFSGGWLTLVKRPWLQFPELHRSWPRLLPAGVSRLARAGGSF